MKLILHFTSLKIIWNVSIKFQYTSTFIILLKTHTLCVFVFHYSSFMAIYESMYMRAFEILSKYIHVTYVLCCILEGIRFEWVIHKHIRTRVYKHIHTRKQSKKGIEDEERVQRTFKHICLEYVRQGHVILFYLWIWV